VFESEESGSFCRVRGSQKARNAYSPHYCLSREIGEDFFKLVRDG